MSSDCVPSSCAPTTESHNKRQDLHVCHVASERVFGVHDVILVYHLPVLLQSQGTVEFLRKRLKSEKVNIQEMEDKGRSLGKRWKDIIMGYASSFTVANSDQMRTLGRIDCLTPLLLHLSENTPISTSVTKALEHSAFRVHLQRKSHQH